MDAYEVPEGIDPKFPCRIEIIVNSYFSIIDGKKMYNKGRTVSWAVDSEEYAVIDLEKDITPYFTWANNQPILESDPECVPDDEAGMIGDYFAPHTTHDPENPVIKEKDTFGDKEEFIQIMRTYAIKNEFETRVEHSDTERYKARCADENCEWKVYAKKLHGGNTFMVVNLSSLDDHTCAGSATLKGHQASTSWISHRAKDIIKEDPTLSAKMILRMIPPPRPTKGKKPRKTKSEVVEASKTVVEPSSMPHSSPGVTTRRMSSLSPTSPGVTTRRMASLSPTSPGVTTRRMAAISPGGIIRRIIIE